MLFFRSASVLCAHRFAQRPGKIVLHAIENPIHKASGIWTAKFFCQFDRFVNRHNWRDIVSIQHFENRESKHVSIYCGNAVKVIILAVTANALIDLREMREHSFNQWLRKLAHARGRRTACPEYIDRLRTCTAMEIAPELVLQRGLARDAAFSHRLLRAQLRNDVRDFDRGPGCFGAAVDPTFETSLARLLRIS
jgi:hypothetical protein